MPINSKKEIHLTKTTSEVMWACNVTTTEHEGDYTSLGIIICYCVWWRVSGDHADGRQALLLNTRVTLLREAYAAAFGRGCQAIMQTAGRHEIPCVKGW